MFVVSNSDRHCNSLVSSELVRNLFNDIRGLYHPFGKNFFRIAKKDGDNYLFRFPVPGAESKDIDLFLEDDVISVKVKSLYEDNSEEVYSTSFMIPKDANCEKIEANVKNGILIIEIPKAESSKPRKIVVN